MTTLTQASPSASRSTKEWQAADWYKVAKEELDAGNWLAAVKLYGELESRYPFGRYAQQAQLEEEVGGGRGRGHRPRFHRLRGRLPRQRTVAPGAARLPARQPRLPAGLRGARNPRRESRGAG